jgi:hypothetical protein
VATSVRTRPKSRRLRRVKIAVTTSSTGHAEDHSSSTVSSDARGEMSASFTRS